MTAYRTGVVDLGYATRRNFEAAQHGEKAQAAISGAIRAACDLAEAGALRVLFALESRGDEAGHRRKKMSGTYKAGRSAPPQEYLDAYEAIAAAAPTLGIMTGVSDQGWEADDVWSTVATTWPGPVLGWSSDKDWLISVSDGAHILRPDTSRRPAGAVDWQRPGPVLITPDNCEEITGHPPHRWLPYLALIGDASDGVAGVPGVGPGKAADLLDACPDAVDLVLEGDLEEAKAGVRKPGPRATLRKMIEHRDGLAMASALVTPQTTTLRVRQSTPDADEASRWLDAHECDAAHLCSRLVRCGLLAEDEEF